MGYSTGSSSLIRYRVYCRISFRLAQEVSRDVASRCPVSQLARDLGWSFDNRKRGIGQADCSGSGDRRRRCDPSAAGTKQIPGRSPDRAFVFQLFDRVVRIPFSQPRVRPRSRRSVLGPLTPGRTIGWDPARAPFKPQNHASIIAEAFLPRCLQQCPAVERFPQAKERPPWLDTLLTKRPLTKP